MTGDVASAGINSNNKPKPQLIHDSSSIYFLHPSEGPGVSLTKYLLLEHNYDVWKKAIVNALEGRNKFGFITGDFPKPTDEKSAEFLAWKANNSTICSWLFNSVDVTTQPSIASYKLAVDLWNDLKERYSVQNGPRIHQLTSEYYQLRQKGMSIVSYYNKFKALWDELYGSEDLTCGCYCVAASKIRARIEKEKTHVFLMGLDDDEYGSLRSQIISMDPFPTLKKAYSLATQEERHKTIIRDRDDRTEAMSFAMQSIPKDTSKSAETRPKCTHCSFGRFPEHEEAAK